MCPATSSISTTSSGSGNNPAFFFFPFFIATGPGSCGYGSGPGSRQRNIHTQLFCNTPPPPPGFDRYPGGSPYFNKRGMGSGTKKFRAGGRGVSLVRTAWGGTPPLPCRRPPLPFIKGGVGYPPPPVGHSTRNTGSGTGTGGGWSPRFCRTGGEGSRLRERKTGGRGVAKILERWGYLPSLFLKLPGPEAIFFRNCQQPDRSFFQILSS